MIESRGVVAALLVVATVLVGTTTVLVVDSPYDANVEREQEPFAPERPTSLDRTTATACLIDYERTRLSNDLLASRGYILDENDEVRTECTAVSVKRTADERFRVRLRCRGEIHDVYRFVQSPAVSYTVTYRLTDEGHEQLSISGYPFPSRDELRRRSASAE
jgi:hypothetical protein